MCDMHHWHAGRSDDATHEIACNVSFLHVSHKGGMSGINESCHTWMSPIDRHGLHAMYHCYTWHVRIWMSHVTCNVLHAMYLQAMYHSTTWHASHASLRSHDSRISCLSMGLIHVWHDSFIPDMPPLCETWLVNLRRDSLLHMTCITCLVTMTWYHSLCETWLVHLRRDSICIWMSAHFICSFI